MTRIALVALVVVSAACKKASKSSSNEGPAEPKATGPFASWDLAGRHAAFQGAHITPGGVIGGAWEAWNVEGDKVTITDGTTEKTFDFELVSPCEAKVTEKSDGGSSSTTHHYTLLDGNIALGLGDAGSRRGPEAIACVSNKVFTVDAKNTCTEWNRSMFDKAKYEQKPATCGFRSQGDKEVFAVTVHGHETMLEVHGDALLSAQLYRVHSEKAGDFAAAKAAREAKK